MLTKLAEAVLPGLREARTPFVAGMLWAGIVWWLLTDDIPARADATGFPGQVYDLVAAAGSGTTLLAAGVLTYVGGVLAVSATELLVAVTSPPMQRVADALDWQRRARLGKRRAKARVKEWEEKTAKADPEKSSRHASSNLERAKRELDELRTQWYEHVWIRRRAGFKRIPTERPDDAHRIAERAVEHAYWEGVAQAIGDVDIELVDELRGPGVAAGQLLEMDLGGDPIETLKALDESLFLDLDRRRAEQDFRVIVSVPVVAVGVAVTLSSWWWGCAIAVLGVVTFVSAVLKRPLDRAQALNQLLLKDVSLPTLRSARNEGRTAALRRRREGALEREKASSDASQ